MHVKDVIASKSTVLRSRQAKMRVFFPWCKKDTPQTKYGVSPVVCFHEGGSHALFWFGQRVSIEPYKSRLGCKQADVHFELKAQLEEVRVVLNRFMPCFVDTIPDIHQDFGFFWFDGLNRIKPLSEIAGRSPSVSVLLAVVSRIIKKPLPAHLICSADVLQNGFLSTVGKLDEKAKTVRELAPGITHFLVADEQSKEDVESIESHGFTVIQCSSVADVLKKVLLDGRSMFQHWEEYFQNKNDIYDALLYGVVNGRSFLNDWSIVRNTTKKIRARFPDKEEGCAFIDHVASRYKDQTFEPIPMDWVLRQPYALQMSLLPHVEQAKVAVLTSTSDKTKKEGMQLFEHKRYQQVLVKKLSDQKGSYNPFQEDNILEAPPILKLWGAHSRVLLVQTMQKNANRESLLREAYKWNMYSLFGWKNLYMYSSISFTVCVMYRIASCLQDENMYKEAKRWHNTISFDRSSQIYLSLEKGKADLFFGNKESAKREFQDVLQQGGWALHPHLIPIASFFLLYMSDTPFDSELYEKCRKDWKSLLDIRFNPTKAKEWIKATYPHLDCELDYFLRAFP